MYLVVNVQYMLRHLFDLPKQEMVTDMSTSDGRFKELSPCSRLANKSDGFEYQEILELEQVSPPRSLRSIGYLRMALTAGSMRGGGGFFATKLTRPVITTVIALNLHSIPYTSSLKLQKVACLSVSRGMSRVII